MKKPSLGTRIRIDSQCVVVLPVYVEPPWDVQNRGSPIRLALIAGRLIFGWVPGIGYLATAFG